MRCPGAPPWECEGFHQSGAKDPTKVEWNNRRRWYGRARGISVTVIESQDYDCAP